MSERQQSPLTDRAIRESLTDRDAPDGLTRSISDYAHGTPQQSGLGVSRWPSLGSVLGGSRQLVVAIVVIALLVVLGVAAMLGSRPSRLSVVPPSIVASPAPSDSPAPAMEPVLPAGWSHVADAPRIDFDGVGPELDGLLVLVNARIGDLGFLDPNAGNGGEIIERLDIGPQSKDLPIAQDDEGWWIGVGGTHELVRFDPATRSIARRLQIGTEAYRIASDGPIVYVTDFGNGRLSRVDTTTEEVTATRDLADAAGVAVLPDGRVLVASRPGSLLEVDPDSLETIDEVAIQGDVMSLIPDGDRVIVTRNNADRLSTIDPANLAAGENLVDESRVSSFTLTDEDAWGIDWQSGDVLRLDRDTLQIVDRVPALSEGQDGISVVAGDIWVEGSNEDGPVVHRLRAP
jgi:glutamine cyclotransferase